MLRLHRHRQAAKSGDKVDFKFSSFKALQVPKGWDKLVVSVVSVESGRTIAKTSKALVRNGSCQWSDSLSESIRVSQDDSSKEVEDCPFKLIVSMGSARPSILGEATVNMTDYMSTGASVLVSLSLQNCSHGTTLQVKIQCTTPRTKSRYENSKERNSHDVDTKSDGSMSDGTVARSLGSFATKDFRLISNPGEPGSRDTSFSLSESHKSYDTEGSIGGEDVSVGDPIGDVHSLVRRAGSIGSENSATRSRPASFNNSLAIGSGYLSENSRQEFPASSLTTTSSAKNYQDTAEGTVEELRAEAKMWERNARKLMLDLDILRGEFSDQSKVQENLNMELLAAYDERDELKKEVEQLKLLLETSLAKQKSAGDLSFLGEDLSHVEKELRDELKFLKESNANLALQLEKSQESNIELVSVLQELEETIEKQKMEIEDLLALQLKVSDMEFTEEANVEEKGRLKDEIQKLQESEKNLNIEVKRLEGELEEKNRELENGERLKSKLLEKEEEIFNLRAKLLVSLSATYSAEMGSINGTDAHLMTEIEALREKVQELERDCSELTEENLELLVKLKESNNGVMRRNTSFEFPQSEVLTTPVTSFEFQLSGQKFPRNDAELGVKSNDENASVEGLQSLKAELEATLVGMDKELAKKSSGVEELQVDLQSKEEEILVLRQHQIELEAKVSDLQKEKIELQVHTEVVLQESEITSKCLKDMRKDLAMLTESVDSHVSANKTLERRSSELEGENAKLSELASSLEAQLRHLTREQESSQLELEKSKSHSVTLQDEINRLRIEMASEKENLKRKLENTEDQLSKAQEECEYLRRANPKLQSTVESLLEECNSLQRLNKGLRNEKTDLHGRCSLLEAKLEGSHKSFTDCSRKVDELEQCLSSSLAEFAAKERSLASEIDALIDENLRHKEKFNQEENLLNHMYMEKAVEVQNLQQEVEHLIKKLSATHEENERISSDAMEEISRIRANNTKLETDFQKAQSIIKQTEDELNIKKVDFEGLSKLLENHKTSEAKLKTTVNNLEIKLRSSESERQQMVEESAHLKLQLPKLACLEAELSAFKNKLDDTKLEKEKLEVFMHEISREREDLKAEKKKLVGHISWLKKSVSELEDCKIEKLALEERENELKKELNLMREENKQYHQKIQRFQEERDECQRRYQTLEEELKLVKEERHHNPREYNGRKSPNFSKTNTKVSPVHDTTKFPKNEMAKTVNQRRDNRRNGLVQEAGKDSPLRAQSQRENGGGIENPDGSARSNGADLGSKIHLLEDQLAKALEENNKYKVQLNKLLSEGRKGQADASRKSRPESELVSKEIYESTKSSLEAELWDIRERYSCMSLKYAQVEAQREELVMKLRTAKTGKRWFS